MYEELSLFWRSRQAPFYGFGPETVLHGLSGFFEARRAEQATKVALLALLLHEYRLSQKVPSGNVGPVPKMTAVIGAIRFQRSSGLKVFWYPVDPLKLGDTSPTTGPELCPAPVIYRYQTDLSRAPETKVVELPLIERFALACAEQIEGAEDLAILWQSTGRGPIEQEVFFTALQGLQEQELLYVGQKPPAKKEKRHVADRNMVSPPSQTT